MVRRQSSLFTLSGTKVVVLDTNSIDSVSRFKIVDWIFYSLLFDGIVIVRHVVLKK